MSSHSSLFPLSFYTLVLLLLAGTTAASDGDIAAASGNVATATFITSGNNSSSATDHPAAISNNGPETYTCVLCAGRDLMLIHWCPIYWDQCHLVCNNDGAANTAAVVPDADGRGGPVSVVPDADTGDNDECYVMKLYNGGRQVIVATMNCGQVKTCGLTCGGGELLGAGKNALPAAGVTPVVSAAVAAFQGRRLADSQRCGVEAAMASARRAVQRGT